MMVDADPMGPVWGHCVPWGRNVTGFGSQRAKCGIGKQDLAVLSLLRAKICQKQNIKIPLSWVWAQVSASKFHCPKVACLSSWLGYWLLCNVSCCFPNGMPEMA